MFRSNQHTALQAIDDVRGVTLVAAGEHELTEKSSKRRALLQLQNVGGEVKKRTLGSYF